MSKQRAIAVEGRAIAARPSLCLLLLCVGVASLFVTPVARAQQLPELVLTRTDPTTTESVRANWTTPRVLGHANGKVISTLPSPFEGRKFAHTAAGGDPGEEVILYSDPKCAAEFAAGSLAELEGTGIEVEVPENSVTTFYAVQTEPGGANDPSECSESSVTYWESSSGLTPEEIEEREQEEREAEEEGSGGGEQPSGQGPGAGGGGAGPPAAPHLHMLPGARANDNAPRVAGSAPGADWVMVFANVKCSGWPIATGTAAALGIGLPIQVADNTSTSLSAIAISSGGASPCSEPTSYVEDSTPPRTKITMGPGVKTRHRKVVFRFADVSEDPPGTTFLCKLDRKKWRHCHSPYKLHRLGRRRHVLRVRGVDVAGNAEHKAAKRRFKVVRRH